MHLCVPNNVGKAVQTDPTLLHYASAIMEQIKMSRSCWLKSLTGFKLCAATPNNTQQLATGCANGCTLSEIQQCWELSANNVACICLGL